MRILMLNYEYPPLGGGAGNATAHILREFADGPEVDIDLVTSSAKGAETRSVAPNVRIHLLDIGKRGNLSHQSSRNLMAYSRRAYGHARNLVGEKTYDVCHAFFGIPCGYLARRLGLPYIVSLRGSDVPGFNERFRTMEVLFLKRLSRRVWRDAARVVANSADLRALALRTAPAQAIDIIENGVDCNRFKPAPTQDEWLRVLCVSRLTKRKRIDLAIRAIVLLKNERVRLTVCGSGDQEDDLKGLCRDLGVADRVMFRGHLSGESLVRAYQTHDVFVLPSEFEGMSNAALEALACGVPALLTETGGAHDLIQDGRNGFVLRDPTPAAIAERLAVYARDPAQVAAHGGAARLTAESKSWRAIADAYLDVYRAVAGRKRA